MYVPAVALACMCLVRCDAAAAVVVLCLALLTNGCRYSGATIGEQVGLERKGRLGVMGGREGRAAYDNFWIPLNYT